MSNQQDGAADAPRKDHSARATGEHGRPADPGAVVETPTNAGCLRTPLFDDVWPRVEQPDIYKNSHAKSLIDHLTDCAAQPYEHPYYGPVMFTSIPRVCDYYNRVTVKSRDRSFGLEGTPQPKFICRKAITAEEKSILEDPTIKPEKLSAASSTGVTEGPEPPRRRRGLRELDTLVKEAEFFQGYPPDSGSQSKAYPRASGPQPANHRNPNAKSPPLAPHPAQVIRPPDSVGSVISDKGSTQLMITRIADGIVYMRELPGPNPHLCRNQRPVLIMEQKVPSSWPSTPQEPDQTGGITSTGEFYISESIAQQCVDDALPQIIQQVQFTFHLYPEVSIIWAAAMAGHWIDFYAFNRNRLPEINLTAANNGFYFDRGSVEDVMDKAYESGLFAFIDESGYYVNNFKKHFHLAVAAAAEQYDDRGLVSPQDAEERHAKHMWDVFGVDAPDSERRRG